MKAVILAAGKTSTVRYGFPEGSPPKCLFHVGGEVILTRMVQALKQAGIKDIRVVTGYGREHIEKFNEEHDLGLELVYNPKWNVDAINSILVGLKNIDQDVLLLFSDIIINASVIRKFVECKNSLAWIKVKQPYTRNFDPLILRGDRMVCITKTAKEKLGMFKQAYLHARNFLGRYEVYRGFKGGKADNLGIKILAALFEMFYRNGPVHDVIIERKIHDLDYYKQSDEYHTRIVFGLVNQAMTKQISNCFL